MDLLLLIFASAFILYIWKSTNRRAPIITVTVTDDPLDTLGWNDTESFEPSDPRPIKASLKFSYRDAAGSSTERLVDVKECDTINPAGYMIGFCRLRNAIRTFRMDRVNRAIDLDTGELIPSLTEFAAKKYNESPVASIDSLFNSSSDALRALLYIGKADGRFTQKEKLIFLAYCKKASGDERIDMEQIEKACKYMAMPTKQAFKLICGRLSKLDEANRMAVIQATEGMIATEKTISSEETEALEYMKKRLTVGE
jgi:hypothetical protein